MTSQLERPASRSSTSAPSSQGLPSKECVRYLRRVNNASGERSQIPKKIVLDKSPILIGRDETCNVMLLEGAVGKKMMSRRHAKLECVCSAGGAGGERTVRWKITDLDSCNGIMVNWVKVNHAYLQEGDIVTFGSAGALHLGESRPDVSSSLMFSFESEQRSQRSSVDAVASASSRPSSSEGASARHNPPTNSGTPKRKVFETIDSNPKPNNADNNPRKRAATGSGILSPTSQAPPAPAPPRAATAEERASAMSSVGDSVGEEVTCPVCQNYLVRAPPSPTHAVKSRVLS